MKKLKIGRFEGIDKISDYGSRGTSKSGGDSWEIKETLPYIAKCTLLRMVMRVRYVTFYSLFINLLVQFI